MALSRRSFLGGLLAAPAVVYVGHLMPIRGVKFDFLRTRNTWQTILEPDGSTTLVSGGKRWLEEWIKHEDPENWGNGSLVDFVYPDGHTEGGTLNPTLDDMKNIIQSDIKLVEERSRPWKEVEEFESKYDRKVYREAQVFSSGSWFESDLGKYRQENIHRLRKRGVVVGEVHPPYLRPQP